MANSIIHYCAKFGAFFTKRTIPPKKACYAAALNQWSGAVIVSFPDVSVAIKGSRDDPLCRQDLQVCSFILFFSLHFSRSLIDTNVIVPVIFGFHILNKCLFIFGCMFVINFTSTLRVIQNVI